MVLCDYESTWQLLFDRNVINHEDAVVLFGSQFTKDKNSSLNIFQNINHIKVPVTFCSIVEYILAFVLGI